MSQVEANRVDRLGACAGALCAVHCVLTAVGAGLVSVAGMTFLDHPWLEAGFVGTTILLGLWALNHGMRRHGSRVPALLFASGLILVLAKHFLPGHGSATASQVALSLAAGVCLVGFFVLNARLPHKACGCFANTACPHQGDTTSRAKTPEPLPPLANVG